MSARLFCGIDWGTTHHAFDVVDEAGKSIQSGEFRNRGDEIDAFIKRAKTWGATADVAFAIEAKDHIIISGLMLAGFQVFHLNPKKCDRFRDRVAASGSKTDALDAFVLASSLRTDIGSFHVIDTRGADLFRISRMLASRERARVEGEACINRVMNELFTSYPDILDFGSLYETAWMRRVVARYPVPSLARKATRAQLDKLIPCGVRTADRDGLLAKLKQARSFRSEADEAIIAHDIVLELETAAVLLAYSEKMYRALGREIDALAATPSADGHASDAAIIASIPGVGSLTCATLITQAASAIEARNVEGLRAISGTAPVSKKSGRQGRPGGRKVEVSMRRACRNDIRGALHNMAANNIIHDPRSKAYYATLRARGIGHAAALRRVADQVVKLMMTLLKAHQLFDLDRRTAQRQPRLNNDAKQETTLTAP